MEWKKVRIKTKTTAEDLISGVLYEMGITGIEVEDNIPLSEEDKKAMYIDILPEGKTDDGTAFLSFYVEEGNEGEELIENVYQELNRLKDFADIGEGKIETSYTKEEDWINNWKEFFHQFRIEDLLITPSWETGKKEEAGIGHVVEIDPGTAFGTGKHETTTLAIKGIQKYVKESMKILDVGCGSGILGIVALKYGAAHVTMTDLDEKAIEATPVNMERNHITSDCYEVLLGDIIEEEILNESVRNEGFDLVTANIITEVLLPLTPVIVSTLKRGGIYITSGILIEKIPLIKKKIEEVGFEILEINEMGEWASIVGRKK